MTTPRALLIDPHSSGFYHLISRCVRKSWLCGRVGTQNYSHRKAWLKERLDVLGSAFAIEIHAYSILSSHFHLAIYSDPLAPLSWSDEEVVSRWLKICPSRDGGGEIDSTREQKRRLAMLADPIELDELRSKLGSVSVFMKLLKQPIARRANLEDGCTGHFFEQRFYSGALLDDAAVIAAMAYVDLNPIRAKIADSIESSDNTSVQERFNNSEEAIQNYLTPVISGLNDSSTVPITAEDYFARITELAKDSVNSPQAPTMARVRSHVAAIGRRQRAYGALKALSDWISVRGLQLRECPLA